LDFSLFVGDVISGVSLDLFGQGYWALGFNCKREFLDSSFLETRL